MANRGRLKAIGTILLSCLMLLAAVVPAVSAPEKTVDVVITTEQGNISLRLYPERAPITVKNFLRNMDAGIYQGGQFYRAVRMDNQRPANTTITLIQGGRNPAVKPLPPVPHETTEMTGISHQNGVISMARLEPGTATSEFFICIGDNSALDYGSDRNPDKQGYATFGVVTDGMEVVMQIQNQPTNVPMQDPNSPVKGQIMEKPVRILNITRK
ncbi:peptidylprolyl isomerase [Emcibacter nanhaiensis]|uniref:peptidylprolyl isomerase n=1 Tax=Emcibacter nanhaiensis TaxID=1505037 RepID=A0A501PR65_9PROT|nr:peptidylprolyl isomerase [Emcibacter nanhaiensis]TPD63020.1 peptidylprolyl isomerase [Emcibacter nanhaiensis]